MVWFLIETSARSKQEICQIHKVRAAISESKIKELLLGPDYKVLNRPR